MARSRRLGIAGEVSVGPDREVHKKSAAVTQPVFRKNLDGRFSYWKNDYWSICQEEVIGTSTNDSFSNKKLPPPGICSGATWAGIFFYTEIADLCRLGFIYTEFAGRLRVRGDGKNLDGCDSARVFGTQRSRIRGDWIVSTQRLPMHWSLRDSLGDDIAFFIPDANKISSSFSCRFFLS